MIWYVSSFLAVAVIVVAGVTRRVRRAGLPDAAVAQLAGGFNVFVAAMLAFTTFALFKFGGEHFVFAAIAFSGVLTILWIAKGLVPLRDRYENGRKAALGHILIFVGTLLFGSVTYFIPLFEWLGIYPIDSGVGLPWLGLITFPIALVLWPSGLALIWQSRPNKSLERTRER
jgi:hypothetical protein